MEFPLTAQDRDYFEKNISSNNNYQSETISDTKRNLIRIVSEMEVEMRMLENKIEEIKTIIYHLWIYHIFISVMF